MIRLRLRVRSQALDGTSREDLKPREGLGKGQAGEAGARRGARRYSCAVGIGAPDERVEPVNGREQAGAGDQTPLKKLAARDLSLGEGFDNLLAVPARVLRFLESRVRCIAR